MLPIIRTSRRSWPSFVDEFFNNDLFPRLNYWNDGHSVPAVNITEGKNEYVIEVAAPGLNKSDFKINLDRNLLTISSEKEVKNETKEEDILRREFSYNSFSRCFTLPETVDADKIKATHKEGILNVVIPKKEKTDKLVKEIKVS